MLLGESDASFQNSFALGDVMSESWSKCMARIAEVEGGDWSDEEKNSKIENLLEN